MKKFLDTSNLVTYQTGKYQGKYDWSNNIGKELYFEYDDISGYIKIIDYVKDIPYGRITLQYKDIITTTHTPALLHLKVPRLFHKEKQKRRYDYNVGDIIHKFNDTLKITKQIRIDYDNSSARGYEIECMDCHYTYETREDSISTCPVCGKKSSYSERFVYSILKQANVKFIPQMEFDWLPVRYYDTYLPDYNAIIEIHGEQHYQPIKLNKNQTPEENYKITVEADKLKYDAATSNGLNYYIINASKPDKLFQEAKNILTFIDFTSISELECEKFANYKNIKQACELLNQGCDIEKICNKLNKSSQTVQQKLRLGNKYGMCIYDKHTNMSNAQKLRMKNTKIHCKLVKCTTTGKIFNFIREANEFYNIKNKTGIYDCLSGKCKTCGKDPITQKPLKWEYFNENEEAL